ncbi:PBS lyase HEAT domain protein repeat-containing protein [Solidesulfovibrio carbinoliphilus subsp. oakridgensis]|uniref:PBS lyase HEAT domain protein repeat-containing protein n=1 Tax=Solidesulfovibrio carbinoliphilus subsp. oakridgensis TaxID=694327 RepID=G7Q6H9_9BACT|nr:HEAT repeat domain-containing protein [Solidesulfovibrio carbinoliphilus]EHJ47592.1 PBS lyase HEAT domain protein repeat-containing protein [Solidesulfovibrio carbinoliphilus subsp. oakridgensis]
MVLGCVVFLCLLVAWKGVSWWKQRALLSKAEGKNVVVATEAVRTIAYKKYGGAVSRLEQLVGKDTDKAVRLAAIEALGAIGRTESASVLVPVLEDPDRDVASQAAVALGRIGSAVATEPLCKALAAKPVQLTALWALGEIGDFSAYETVRRFRDDPDPYVSYNAVQALKKLGAGG